MEEFSRTELLLGREAMERLGRARVAVFGIGGVGGYVCEALARSGIGALDLIDRDSVGLTNINRQIIATRKTLGLYKVDVMKERILDINPQACVRTYRCFFLPENAQDFPFEEYDYIVDAVDMVTAKLALAVKGAELGIPVVSSMGAGNKLDPGSFRIADIYDTKVCPLARVMRRELKKRGIEKLKVVYSEEIPVSIPGNREAIVPDPGEAAASAPGNRENTFPASGSRDAARDDARRSVPGSVAFVPPVAGLLLAGEVVKDLAAGVGRKGRDRDEKTSADCGG